MFRRKGTKGGMAGGKVSYKQLGAIPVRGIVILDLNLPTHFHPGQEDPG